MTRLLHCVFLVTLITLSGCSSLGQKNNAPVIERGEPVEQVKPKPLPAKPAKSTETPKKGGYYLDDGPGPTPPADIDSIPDAVPHAEPFRAANSRPYSALGIDYTPMTELQPYKATGIASWYGRRYHGQKTSSGELYDMYGMTAAHTILPIPSYVRVTNPENGRSVIVRVNDRGPFKQDRLIDLSYAAAYKLRLTQKGSGLVEVELIDPRLPAPQEANKAVADSAPAAGNYVQLGAFRQKENADQLCDKLKQQGLAQGVGVESWYNAELYRVRVGPYSSRQEADTAAANIKQTLGVSTLVTNQ